MGTHPIFESDFDCLTEKMVLLSGEEFLGEMTKLFQGCRDIGSVVFTVKPYDGQDRPEPRTGAPGKWKKQKLVLIRASDGKRKISTVVNGEALPGFQVEYCKLLRANMNGLPKRPKKKKTAVDN